MKKYIILFLLLTVNLTWAKTKQQTYLLFNETKGEIVVAENIHEVRSIASITKLMTAMVALDYSDDLGKSLIISKRQHTNLPSKQHTRMEVLTAMLVRSDNAAAETIAEDYPGGREAFIQAMNAKAKSIGLLNTQFAEPTGLSVFNISTAEELSKMVNEASKYYLIRTLSTTKEIAIDAHGKKKTYIARFNNTNRLALEEFHDIVVSKTGLTNMAGSCVAMAIEHAGQKYIMIVLGAKNGIDRLKTVKQIMYNHIINHAN